MEQDINKFEHAGQLSSGCSAGEHLLDDREGHMGIETDGDFTKIIMKCLACGKHIGISAPLGLNDFLNKQSNPTTESTHQNPLSQEDETSFAGQSDVLKRILQ